MTKKIVIFKEDTSSSAIDNLISEWESGGFSVLMSLPFINGVALQIPADIPAGDLLDNIIIDTIQDNKVLDLLTIRGMGEGGAGEGGAGEGGAGEGGAGEGGAGEGGAGEGGAGEGGAGEEPPPSAITVYDKPTRLGDRPWGVLDLYDASYDPMQYMDYEALLEVPALVRIAQLNVNRIKIAIFDTGIDFYHNRLNHLVKGGVDLVDFNPGLPIDENGHGTHIAGTLAAWEFGVAPEAELYAVKILDENAMGDLTTLVMGLQWALNHDIDVVNMSIGFRSDNPIVRKAVASAHAAGLIMVAAVGNHSNWEDDNLTSGEGGAGEGGAGEGGAGEGGAGEGGASTDCGTKAPYSVMYPAAYPQVIAVGAIDSYEQLAWFSNTGPETDILAPGVNVVSTNLYDGFGIANGTSMATPHITGAVALMLALAQTEGVDLTSEQIKNILRDTAVDGIIDLRTALDQVHAESMAGSLVDTADDTLTNTVNGISGFLNW